MNGNKMDKLPEGLREFLANLSKSEMMVLEEMADELEGDRFFTIPCSPIHAPKASHALPHRWAG